MTTDVLPIDAPERPGYTYTRSSQFYDPSGRLSIRDLPCSQLIVDFNTTAWGPLDAPRTLPRLPDARAARRYRSTVFCCVFVMYYKIRRLL